MEKKGSEPGGQEGEGGSGSEWGFTEGWRNVHESFLFYCTFSIILRNSDKEKKMDSITFYIHFFIYLNKL